MGATTTIVQQAYEAFSRRDIPAILELVADEGDWEFVGSANLAYAGRRRTRAEVADFFADLSRAEDIRAFEPREFIEAGEYLTVLGWFDSTALDTGKIEATDWGTLSVNDEAGYNRIAPYAIYPGIHSMNSTDFVVRRSKWNALSADQKAVVYAALEEWNIATLMNQEWEDRQAAAKRDPSTLITWGEKEKLELRQVAQTVWESWSKKSPLAKEIYDSQVAFLKKMGKL